MCVADAQFDIVRGNPHDKSSGKGGHLSSNRSSKPSDKEIAERHSAEHQYDLLVLVLQCHNYAQNHRTTAFSNLNF
jgi:hypothetical protein